MLRLLMSLGPIAALLIGGLGSGAIVAAGMSAYNRWIENPRIIAIERERVLSQVEAAAANARRSEQERQVKIADRAMTMAAEAEAALEAQHDADLKKLSERIKAYEQTRLDEGRSCPLSGDDILFLNGLRDGAD